MSNRYEAAMPIGQPGNRLWPYRIVKNDPWDGYGPNNGSARNGLYRVVPIWAGKIKFAMFSDYTVTTVTVPVEEIHDAFTIDEDAPVWPTITNVTWGGGGGGSGATINGSTPFWTNTNGNQWCLGGVTLTVGGSGYTSPPGLTVTITRGAYHETFHPRCTVAPRALTIGTVEPLGSGGIPIRIASGPILWEFLPATDHGLKVDNELFLLWTWWDTLKANYGQRQLGCRYQVRVTSVTGAIVGLDPTSGFPVVADHAPGDPHNGGYAPQWGGARASIALPDMTDPGPAQYWYEDYNMWINWPTLTEVYVYEPDEVFCLQDPAGWPLMLGESVLVHDGWRNKDGYRMAQGGGLYIYPV